MLYTHKLYRRVGGGGGGRGGWRGVGGLKVMHWGADSRTNFSRRDSTSEAHPSDRASTSFHLARQACVTGMWNLF